MGEIERLAKLKGSEINEAKKQLATEATALVHGREEAEAAAETARQTFETGETAAGLPAVTIASSEVEAGLGLLKALVSAGLAFSNGEARRAMQGAGVRVNDRPVSDERLMLSASDIGDDGVIKLSLGRKKHVLLRPV